MDPRLPSPQVSGLLNKAAFPFQPTLSLAYWLSKDEQLNLTLVTIGPLLPWVLPWSLSPLLPWVSISSLPSAGHGISQLPELKANSL